MEYTCTHNHQSQFIEWFGNPFEESDDKVKLGTLCEINPTKPKGLSDDLCVSFIPMDKVNEDGTTSRFEVRSLSEVKKGFTYCQDNDVLFAKITPCMENGKGAVMTGLSNRIGFGSTEFHVLRPKEGVTTPTWLYHLTKMDLFRLDAAKNMTGTGGQKRVPTQYLENFMVSTPSLDLQNQFMELASQADKSKYYKLNIIWHILTKQIQLRKCSSTQLANRVGYTLSRAKYPVFPMIYSSVSG